MKALVVLLLASGVQLAAAQSLPAVYLNEREEETVPDSATHYRIAERNLEAGLAPVREYAMNGTLLLRGFLTPQEPQVRNGLYTWYYPSGAKSCEVPFQNGQREGVAVSWYDNGQVRERGEYHHGQRTGRWLTVHSNGQKRSEGHYEAGIPTGEWRYYYNNGQLAAVEQENSGKLPALTFYNQDGTQVQGTSQRRLQPVFPGGEASLIEYLAQHTEYPKDARRKGITGKVYVSYTVEEDGRIGQVHIVRGLSPDIDIEALRVVKSLPKFQPGREYNVPTAFTYTVPITFAPNFNLFGGHKPVLMPPVEARGN
jgi:TonB family protein